MPALRDENREVALIAQNILGTSPVYITGATLTNSHPLHVAIVDSSGSQLGSFNPLGIPVYDYVSYTNTNSTTDTYTFKVGGSGGVTVATLTIVYTDTTKSQISSVTKS